MSADKSAEQIGVSNLGYLAGHADGQQGETAMTEVQLGHHSGEYAAGYRAGYAKGREAALTAAEAELDALAEQTKAAYAAYRIADQRQTGKAEQIRELRQKLRREQQS